MGQRNPLDSQDETEFIEPRELEETYNFVEKLTRRLGVEDNLEAAQLLNLARMGRLERQQTALFEQMMQLQQQSNQLLQQIAQRDVEFNVGDLDVDLGEQALAEAVSQGTRDANTSPLIPIPYSDSLAFLPPSTESDPIEIDLTNGTATVPGVGQVTRKFNNLDVLEENDALSVTQFADGPVEFKVFDSRNNKLAEFTTPWGFGSQVLGPEVARFELILEFPIKYSAAMSTSPVPPVNLDNIVIPIERVGKLTTGNSLQPVPFIPSGPTEDILSSFKVDDVDTAIENFGHDSLASITSTQQGWVIQNAGANDLQYQVLVINQADEAVVADPDIHGTTDPTDTIQLAAADIDVLESGIQSTVRQVRVANVTPGNPTEARVQYVGKSPSVR